MPIYRYKCEEHGQFDEVRLRQMATSEDPGATCRQCQQLAPRMFTTRCDFYLNSNAATQKTGWASPGMSSSSPAHRRKHTAMRRLDGTFQDGVT